MGSWYNLPLRTHFRARRVGNAVRNSHAFGSTPHHGSPNPYFFFSMRMSLHQGGKVQYSSG